MAEASVAVTAGAGTLLHTNTRTISASTMHDEYTLPGEYAYATYTVDPEADVSVATANSHLLQIMAGAALNVRIRRLYISQAGNATAAAMARISIVRLTTAGTGGTAVTPRPLDSADAAAGAAGMTLPTVKGAEGVFLWRRAIVWRQAIAATATQFDYTWEWVQHPYGKPIIIPAGTTNGIALKMIDATAGASVVIGAEFVETAFV